MSKKTCPFLYSQFIYINGPRYHGRPVARSKYERERKKSEREKKRERRKKGKKDSYLLI